MMFITVPLDLVGSATITYSEYRGPYRKLYGRCLSKCFSTKPAQANPFQTAEAMLKYTIRCWCSIASVMDQVNAPSVTEATAHRQPRVGL